MKLDSDLVRKVMLYLEEKCNFNEVIVSEKISIDDYSEKKITYTIMKLRETGYINSSKPTFGFEIPIVLVNSLAWEGHQFLDTVRDEKVWAKKDIVSKIASVSITTLKKVATEIVINMIQK